MSVEVRPAAPGDYERVGRLTVAAYAALPGRPVGAAYEEELRAVARRAAGAVVLVAVEDGQVRGAVTYVPDPDSPWAEGLLEGEASVRMLAVDPAAQGRGAGTALLEACVDLARVSGRARVVLHSTPWMTAAHRLYRRLGFRRAPERDWQPLPHVPLLGFVLEVGGSVAASPGGGTGETQGA